MRFQLYPFLLFIKYDFEILKQPFSSKYPKSRRRLLKKRYSHRYSVSSNFHFKTLMNICCVLSTNPANIVWDSRFGINIEIFRNFVSERCHIGARINKSIEFRG